MLTRWELTALAQEILSEGDPIRLADLIEEFDRHVPHPAPSDLFLFPELQFGDQRPTVEDIVDAALSYQDPSGRVACQTRPAGWRRRPRFSQRR